MRNEVKVTELFVEVNVSDAQLMQLEQHALICFGCKVLLCKHQRKRFSMYCASAQAMIEGWLPRGFLSPRFAEPKK